MALDFISKEDLKEVLSKNWLTHDAMWFALSVESIGIEKTNEINKKAARNMAIVEAKRLSKVLKIENISSIKELITFMDKAFAIIVGEFMKGSYKQEDDNKLIFETKKCFAYEGVSKIGVIGDYDCGIFERIEGWFDFFKIHYSKETDEAKCLMYLRGDCVKVYTFDFSQ